MRHLLAAILTLSVAIGCKPGTASEQDPQVAQGGESPQDVFEKAKAAGLKKEWKTLFTLFAPDERDEIIFFMIVGSGFGIAGEEGANKELAKEHNRELKEILKKHGLDKDDGKKTQIPWDDQEKMRKEVHEQLKDVKDKPALAGELMALMEKLNMGKNMNPPFASEKASLKDVKIEGDRAKGTIDRGDGKSGSQLFVKHKDRWYLSMEEDKSASQEERKTEAEIRRAFAQAQFAAENKDWNNLYSVLNPADHDMAIAEATAAAQMIAGDKELKSVEALLGKHGLKDVKVSNINFSKWEEARKQAKEVFKGAKDRPGLFADLMKFAVEHDRENRHVGELKGALENVKVAGQKASGTLKSDTKNRALRFVKYKDQWFLDQWYPIP